MKCLQRRRIFIFLIPALTVFLSHCSSGSGNNPREINDPHQHHAGNPNSTPPNSAPPSSPSDPQKSTVELTVKGIVCAACKNNLEGLLRKEDGVISATVFLDREKNNVVVEHNPKMVPLSRITTIITDGGWEVVN